MWRPIRTRLGPADKASCPRQRSQCGRRDAKRDEERVALRIDLDATVRGERLAQDAPVLLEDVRVPSPSSWSSRVDPSMSVNRNVTVPVGSRMCEVACSRLVAKTDEFAWFPGLM